MARVNLLREKVYDPVLRVIHAWNALAILLLILTSETALWLGFGVENAVLWRLHAGVGYALILGLVARLVWALHGPHHAGWQQLWTWRAWFAAVRHRTFFTAPARFGHHPLATAAYLALYGMVLVMACTGLALAAIDQGHGPLYPWLGHALLLKPWFHVPHAFLEVLIEVFVVAHLAALILHEARHGIPLAQAMVSGYQYRDDTPADAPRN